MDLCESSSASKRFVMRAYAIPEDMDHRPVTELENISTPEIFCRSHLVDQGRMINSGLLPLLIP